MELCVLWDPHHEPDETQKQWCGELGDGASPVHPRLPPSARCLCWRFQQLLQHTFSPRTWLSLSTSLVQQAKLQGWVYTAWFNDERIEEGMTGQVFQHFFSKFFVGFTAGLERTYADRYWRAIETTNTTPTSLTDFQNFWGIVWNS